MVDFAALKANRKQSFNDLAQKLAAPQGQNFRQRDERYWTLKPDAAGNASAIIRFLPQGPTAEPGVAPYVLAMDHAFKVDATQKWYIEKDLGTIGQDDPCQQLYSSTWKSGDKEGARLFKRRTKYHANILVVKDPQNPENEGKVFIWAFGVKILEMIQEVMVESDDPLDDTVKFNPFCMWEGANFRVRQQKVEGWPNYSKSKFDAPSPVGTDEEIEEIWNTAHSLAFLTDPSSFKSYAELQDRLNIVRGLTEEARSDSRSSETTQSRKEIDVTETRTPTRQAAPVVDESDDEDDEELDSWLQKRLNDDA